VEIEPLSGRLRKIIIWTFFIVAGYASFIAFPLQYLPLPGYRAIGEPLTGGWRWGKSFGCFDDKPVLYFEGKDGFLVREGEIIWKLFENLKFEASSGTLELKGVLYPHFPAGFTESGTQGAALGGVQSSRNSPSSSRSVAVRIRYNDVGKILHLRDMYMDGQQVNDKTYLKSFILAQCGYPGLTLNLIRLFGLRKYWRSPAHGLEPETDIIEVR